MLRVLWTAVVLVLALGSLAHPGAAQERTLRIGVGLIPSNPDPAFDTQSLALFAYSQMFDTLVVADDRGELRPALLESWRVRDDKLTWEFTLRRGVRFHNGEEWDAAALKFNLERIADPKVKSHWRNRTFAIARVEVMDKHRALVVTQRPWAVLLKDLLVISMIPPKYYAQVGPGGFSRAPVGTGPFKFDSYDKLAHITFTAADRSWRGKPSVGKVVFRRLPEAATRVAALEADEIDVAVDVPVEDVRRLQARGLRAKAVDLAQSQIFILRSTVDSPLKDVRVRQAMNYAIDKEGIVQNLLQGYGRLLQGQLVGPEAFGFNPALKPYPYDPERARKLLAEAGYPNGFEIRLHGTQGRYPKDTEFQEAVVAQLEKVGIRAMLEIVDSGVFISQFAAGRLGPVFVFGQQYFPSIDVNQVLPMYRTGAPQKLLASKEFDDLYQAQASEMDARARLVLLHKLGHVFRDTAPVVFMHQLRLIFGSHARVKDFEPRVTGSADLSKVSLAP